MRGTWSLGWHYLKEKKGRAALTGAGIALGVALVVGVLIANASTANTFDGIIAGINGRANVIVSPVGAWDASLSDETVKRIRTQDGVEASSASFGFETERIVPGPRNSINLFWLDGVDPTDDARLRSWTIVDGAFPRPGVDEVAIDKGDADFYGMRLGTKEKIKTPTGPRTVRVSAIVSETGQGGRAGGGNVSSYGRVLTSVDTARSMSGVAGAYRTLSLVLSDGVDADRWIEQHRDVLTGVTAVSTAGIQREFDQLLDLFLGALTWVASIALFIGGFLIYLTLSRSVADRIRTHGIMRAIGAGRRHVWTVILGEAALLGVVSTVVGVLLGLLIARAVTGLLGVLGFPKVALVVRPSALIVGAIVGIGTTLATAALPARRAARVDPAQAIRGRVVGGLSATRTWIAGAALVVLGVVVALIPTDRSALEEALVYFVTMTVLLGCVLMVPVALRPLAWLLGRITRHIAPGTGDVSVRHLVRERSRSAYTLGLIMIVLAGLFAYGAMDASIARATDDVFDAQYSVPEVIVRSEQGVLATVTEQSIRQRPDVSRTTAIRFSNSRLSADEAVQVLVVDPVSYFELAGFSWTAGDEASAHRDLGEGAILLAEGLAQRDDVRRGDRLSLETSRGPHGFVVAGKFLAFLGVDVVMSLDTAREYLNAGKPAAILVDLRDGADAGRFVSTLNRDLRPLGATSVTTEVLRREFQPEIRDLLRIFMVILLITVVIGLLGLANTLTMSVAERMTEIGVMRATGASRGHVRRMVICEGATLGFAAFVLAVPLGWLMTTLVSRGASLEGLTLHPTFPAGWVPVLVLISTLVAVLASVGPAWRAGRLRPAEALRFE